MTNRYEEVVIDGANIVHDSKMDSEGNKILLILPERLEKAIRHCESLGWPTTAILNKGTFRWAAKLSKKGSDLVGDIDILNRLISERKVVLIDRKKEDIYWVDYGVKRNAWLITHDRLREERAAHKRDWDDIEARMLRGHEFINEEFILPGLPKKEVESADDAVTISMHNRLRERLSELESRFRELSDKSDIAVVATSASGSDAAEANETIDIVEAIYDQMLKAGDRVEVSHFQRVLAGAILGHDIESYPKAWPPGWPAELSSALGMDGRRLNGMLKELSPRVVEITSRNEDGNPPHDIYYGATIESTDAA